MISVDKYLFPIQRRFQGEYNLDKLLNKLNNPEKQIPVINIVGTNGKGSTSFYLSLGLKQKFKKVGLFISPAFLYHNERIQINNVPISDDDLIKYTKQIDQYIEEYNLTFFEIWTLIAILYFKDNNVDIAVIEAGIGGIKDSTNLFSNQLMTGLTSVSIDHTEVLGNSVEEIIYQKVNIAKPNTKLIVSYDNYQYIDQIKESLINDVEVIQAKTIKDTINYQEGNKGLVKEILNILDIKVNEILKVDPPIGRFSKIIKNNVNYIIDGAHNIDGIKNLIKSIENKKNIKVLYASIEEKDYLQILNLLKNSFEQVYITSFDFLKSWNIDKVEHNNKVDDWKQFIDQNKSDLLICGSLYFAPLVYEYLNKK